MAFGFLGALANTLPGYQQGRQQAVMDNWTDLTNANKTRAGQLQNAFDEQVLAPRIQMMNTAAALQQMQAGGTAMDYAVKQMGQQGRLGAANINSMFAPQKAQAMNEAYMQMVRRLGAGGGMGYDPFTAMMMMPYSPIAQNIF